MHIAYSLDELHGLVAPASRHAATIGNFDGVHMGHRRLLARTRERAAAAGVPAVVITFDPHPLRVISGVHLPDLLTTLPRKLELLRDVGMDLVLVLQFTPAMAALTPEQFVRFVMVDGLHLTNLVIGYDYALGKGRVGDFAALSALGGAWGFAVERMEPLTIGGETVSSSLIRKWIRAGAMDQVRPLLGRLHSVEGEVIRGQGRGRTLGFPTANLRLGDALLPPPGVYATWAEILLPPDPAGQAIQATAPLTGVTSVGTNPTFGGTSVSFETYLLNYNEDLYGKTLRVHFAKRLREEIRFADVRSLTDRIAADAREARAYLDAHAFQDTL